MRKIIRLWLIFTVLLVACIPANKIITPTVAASPVPENSAIASTPTPHPGDTNTTPVILNKLQPGKEYIFYISYTGPKGVNHELWGVDPISGESTLFARGIDWFLGWSHPGNKWLLSTKHALYVANPDGSDLHKVYEDQKYTFTYSWWLSDNLILINAYPDLQLPPQFYILDLTSGKTDDITSSDDPKFIEAVSSTKNVWIEASLNSGRTQVNDVSNHPHSLFNDIKIRIDPFGSSNMGFLPDGDQLVFIGSQKVESTQGNPSKLLLASLADNHLETLFEADQNSTINGFRISPDGHYVVFTYSTEQDTFINFLNLQTRQIDYQWVYPYWPGLGYFQWSPDSKFIVMTYVSSGPGTIPKTRSGIQIMNITNGETRLILDENVQIIGWRLYNK